jgi:hypothetical protein
MGVWVCDSADKDRDLKVNWWAWRPTVELIRASGLLHDADCDHLSDGIGELDRPTCLAVAAFLEAELAKRALAKGERILLDGTVTDVPDDGTFHREPSEQHKNYSVGAEWLSTFIEFLKTSDGIYVS